MIKNIFKVGLCSGGCFIVSGSIILILGPIVQNIYVAILQSFSVIVTVAAALTFAFFTYTDNIEQKLSELYKKFKEIKVDQAHESIGSLKKELLLNVFFILCMAVFEKLVSGIDFEKYQIILGSHKIEASLAGVASRMSIFLLALLVLVDQVRAFLTAIKLRQVVSKGASK